MQACGLLLVLGLIETICQCTGWMANTAKNLAISDSFPALEMLVLQIVQFVLNTSTAFTSTLK